MSDRDPIDRRTVLRTSGTALTAVCGVSATAAADPGEERDDTGRGPAKSEVDICPVCENIEIVSDHDDHRIVAVELDGASYLLNVEKESGAVSVIDQAFGDRELTTAGGASIQNHNNIIESTNLITNRFGSCGGYIYSDHYEAIVQIETSDALDQLPESLVAAAVCGVLTSWAGIGAAIGAMACGLGQFLFFDHIDLVGTNFSIGAWDDHAGWLNEERVQTGVSNGLASSRSDLIPAQAVSGPHLELGGAISDYL